MPKQKDSSQYFTTEEKERVQHALAEKGHLGNCRQCGAKNWFINNGPAWIRLGNLPNLREREHGHAHVVCRGCGEARLISLWAIDLKELSDEFSLDVPAEEKVGE